MMRASNSRLVWAPRVIGLAFVGFLALFSLDVFEPGLSAWQILGGLIIHNIPAFVMAAVVYMAWRHEVVGAIAFAAAGVLYIGLLLTSQNFQPYMLSWSVTVAGPAFLVSWLYWRAWRYRTHTPPGASH